MVCASCVSINHPTTTGMTSCCCLGDNNACMTPSQEFATETPPSTHNWAHRVDAHTQGIYVAFRTPTHFPPGWHVTSHNNINSMNTCHSQATLSPKVSSTIGGPMCVIFYYALLCIRLAERNRDDM